MDKPPGPPCCNSSRFATGGAGGGAFTGEAVFAVSSFSVVSCGDRSATRSKRVLGAGGASCKAQLPYESSLANSALVVTVVKPKSNQLP